MSSWACCSWKLVRFGSLGRAFSVFPDRNFDESCELFAFKNSCKISHLIPFLQLHNFIPSFETTVTLCTITIMNELLLFLLIYTQCQCNENLYRWDYCNCLWKKEVKYSSLQWSYPGWGYYWRLLLTLATDSLEWRHITIRHVFTLYFRPVRLRMNFKTNMEMVGKRFPYLAKYKV